MRKKSYLIVVIVFLILSINCSYAGLGSQQPPLLPTGPYIQIIPNTECAAVTLQICGINFGLSMGSLGTLQNITMPERFVTRDVTLQCSNDGVGVPYYHVTNNLASTCDLKPCTADHIRLCHTDIPLNLKTSVGDLIKLSIPTDFLAKKNPLPVPDIYAECIVDGDQLDYLIRDESTISCNIFACPPTQVSACEETLNISEFNDLGTVVKLETSTHQPVTVECVGSQAYAPQYKVIDQVCN